MKKQVLTLMIMLAALVSFTQSIPNAGFELWTNMGLYVKPDSWATPNSITYALLIATVEQDATDPYEGSYSAKLTTTSAMAGLYTIPGFLTLGDFNFNLLTQQVKLYGGIAYPYRPDKISLYFKYLPVNGDNWFIAVEFFNTDTITGEKHIVGGTSKNVYDSTGIWTLFEAPVNFKPGETADSMSIYILSSNVDTPQAGSVLYIDKIFFDINSSTADLISYKTNISVFPNPASGYVSILSENELIRKITIFDMAGKQRGAYYCDSKYKRIDLPELSPGMYLLKARLDDGSIAVRKLWVR